MVEEVGEEDAEVDVEVDVVEQAPRFPKRMEALQHLLVTRLPLIKKEKKRVDECNLLRGERINICVGATKI